MRLVSVPRLALFRSQFRRRRALRSRRITMFALLAVLICVITPFYIIYKPPQFIIRLLQQRWPNVLFHVPTSTKMVALTIDDGPSQHTQELLEVLKANGATATWFIIGGHVEDDRDREVLKTLVQDGHELANHAMHDETSKALGDETLREQIKTVEAMIKRAYASALGPQSQFPKYFRPGGGFFSQRMLKLLAELDYRLILGDIYPHDPFIPYWRVNAHHILSMLHSGGIIICHDARGWTLPMLKRVLPEIRRRGYRIVTVTELLRNSKKQ